MPNLHTRYKSAERKFLSKTLKPAWMGGGGGGALARWTKNVGGVSWWKTICISKSHTYSQKNVLLLPELVF
jgi:hypothetical protein